ncbi:MAG: hypothetical protein AABX35_02565 [Nanoarchaeota archaeon]
MKFKPFVNPTNLSGISPSEIISTMGGLALSFGVLATASTIGLIGLSNHLKAADSLEERVKNPSKKVLVPNTQTNIDVSLPKEVLDKIAPGYASFWNNNKKEFGTNTAGLDSHLTLYVENELDRLRQNRKGDQELSSSYYGDKRERVIVQQTKLRLLTECLAKDPLKYNFDTNGLPATLNGADLNLYLAHARLNADANYTGFLSSQPKKEALIRDYSLFVAHSQTLFSGLNKKKFGEGLEGMKDRLISQLRKE